MIQHDLFDPPTANPLVPPLGDKSRIRGLEAQVEDLKYTLSNILQYFVSSDTISPGDRRSALVEDAQAALRAKPADYLD